MFSELYLTPVNEHYGPGYQSGQIRIAFVPGNKNSSRQLMGGVILGDSKAARTFGMRKYKKVLDWSNTFNEFGIKWTPGIYFTGI